MCYVALMEKDQVSKIGLRKATLAVLQRDWYGHKLLIAVFDYLWLSNLVSSLCFVCKHTFTGKRLFVRLCCWEEGRQSELYSTTQWARINHSNKQHQSKWQNPDDPASLFTAKPQPPPVCVRNYVIHTVNVILCQRIRVNSCTVFLITADYYEV